MEGSPTGPASFGQLDPKIENADGSSPLSAVPVGGTEPGSNGSAPGPASVSVPGAGPQQPPTRPAIPQQPQQAQLGPVEQILLTELQELKGQTHRIRLESRAVHIAIGLCAVAAIVYLTMQAKAKLPDLPSGGIA